MRVILALLIGFTVNPRFSANLAGCALENGGQLRARSRLDFNC
jgi:hypothetical protein